MLFSDTYQTIAAPAFGEYKDRGSKFLAFAYPVKTEEEAKEKIQQLKQQHPDAVHHCWAMVLGAGSAFQKSTDDREPANTAGRPILRTILSKQLTNVIVIVVRYFGGKLLGVSGLIEAYSSAAKQTLDQSEIKNCRVVEVYEMIFAFAHEGEAFRILKQAKATILQHESNENGVKLLFEIPKSEAQKLLSAIKEKSIFETRFVQEY